MSGDVVSFSKESLEKASGFLKPYIDDAAGLGLVFRELNGVAVRLGEDAGVDLNAVGEIGFDDPDSMPDEEFYDNTMMACWVLCEVPEVIIEALAEGGKAPEMAFRSWMMNHLTSVKAECVAMKAFLARWVEYRIELERVFGSEVSEAAEK